MPAEVALLGVADLLATGPRNAAQLATELGVDAGALHRCCAPAPRWMYSAWTGLGDFG